MVTKLRPSLLDRLVCKDPTSIAMIREGLRRDLQDMLQTTRRTIGWSQDHAILDASLFNYGIPDLATIPLATMDQRRAAVDRLAELIRNQDGRFKDVKVQFLPNASESERTIRLRVDATFDVDGAEDYVSVLGVLDPMCNAVSVVADPT